MKLKNISKEDLETMNYDDIAYLIISEEKKAMKINTLFQKVCNALDLNEQEFVDKIADFFELLTTDKRFIMLEDGSWDLKELYNPTVVVDDYEEETIKADIDDDEENIIEEEKEDNEEDIFYDQDNDDDLPDDDLDDLVVIDIDDEETNS